MEKDIDRIPKNPETDIVIRIDEFNGRMGVTIREYVKSERYTGFTKAGTRIPADKFHLFKKAINMIDENDLKEQGSSRPSQSSESSSPMNNAQSKPASTEKKVPKKSKVDVKDVEF